MQYRLNCGIWNSVFAVPTDVVDRHLKLCGSAQLKVLLTLLRHAGEPMELSRLAADLGLSPGDTQDALNYWVQCGIFSAQEQAGGLELVPAARTGEPKPAAAPPKRAASVSSSPPQKMKPPEIQQLLTRSPELRDLLREAEAVLGKTLTSSDLSTLASLYDWAGIPAGVLLMVVQYCKEIGKTNLRYVEKVAIGWQERGIDTLEKAEHYIQESLETEAQVRLVKAAFGIYDRALTSKETDCVRQWLHGWGFDISVIKLAYERAVERTGKVSFPYINKILSSWHEKNITTTAQAAQEGEAFARQKAQQDNRSSYDIQEVEQFLLHNSPKLED